LILCLSFLTYRISLICFLSCFFSLFLFALTHSLSCLHTLSLCCVLCWTHTFRILECHEFLREQMKER
jgi:hypothetical protein